jgi:hypothetical protein
LADRSKYLKVRENQRGRAIDGRIEHRRHLERGFETLALEGARQVG